jgi:hypothetical protein
MTIRIWDSSVGIGTGYELVGRDSFRGENKSVQRSTHPPTGWIPRTLSSGEKRPGSEADHSPTSSVEVKNGGAIPPLPHMSLLVH